MAHYAILNNNNIVKSIIVIDTESTLDENGIEKEELGIEICKKVLNDPNTIAVRTSYNNSIRVRYAGIGYVYDEELDAFIPPKPYHSWTLNSTTLDWDPPIPEPQTQPENGVYAWDEDTQNWIVVTFPPKQITVESFRSQLTLIEKLLWDNPDTANTLSQKSAITTFKNELPLTEGTTELTELLNLLVSEGVFTQQRLVELISNL